MPDEACGENKLSPVEEKHCDIIESVIKECEYEYLSDGKKEWSERGDYWIVKDRLVLRIQVYGTQVRIRSAVFLKSWEDETYDELGLYKAVQNALFPALALRRDGSIEYTYKVPEVSDENLAEVVRVSIDESFGVIKRCLELRKSYNDMFVE